MSREIRSRERRPLQVGGDPYIRDMARRVGKLGETLHNMTVSLHDTSPEDWFNLAEPTINRLAAATQQLEQELQSRSSQYFSSQQQQQPPRRVEHTA